MTGYMRALIIAAVLVASTAQAQGTVCGMRDAIVAGLSGKYGEVVNFIGVQSGRGIVELWLSPAGTWTLTVTSPARTTCLIAAGDAGEIVKPVVKGEPS